MAAKARTRRMSFVLPRKFDESAIEYIRNRIVNSNRNERESAIKAIELNSRNAPIYISEVRCLPGDGDTTLCLLHTNGSQFQFTRWYTFLSKTLSFVERMDQKSKLAQIDDFASRMRHLDSESVFPFDVPDQRTPTKKRSQLETEDEAVEQPVTKQLVLSTPEKSSLTRVPGSSSTVMMRQTILTGASQPLSSQLGGEPLLSQHRAVGYEEGSVHTAMLTPSGGAMAKLGDYLVGRYPTYKGHKTFEGRKDGESAEAFRDRARKQRNSVPMVGKIMTLFLPPVLQSSKGSGGLFAVLSAGHAELLVTLQKMCCKGVYSPSMTPDSQELSYGVDCLGGGEMSRKSCFLELWRRALNLERALADLLKFLLGMVECVTPSTLKTVSLQTLGNLRALLLSGAGLYGGGSDFWNARSMACIEKLNEGGDPRVHETITWLSGNRANAFSVLSPFIEELNVLLPTLAQIALIKDDLCRLDDEATAQGVFNTLNDDRKLRMNVHTQCCGWLIVYGGKLTWLVEQVHAWCKEFESIARELRMVKPGKVELLLLSEDGKIIGLDGQALDKGHVDADSVEGLLPFPDYCMSVQPVAMDKLEEMSKQYRDIQDGMLQAMILSPEVKEALAISGHKGEVASELHAVKCMQRGVQNISEWLKEDSHVKMLTCYLPATASMPDAVYSPDEIYKSK